MPEQVLAGVPRELFTHISSAHCENGAIAVLLHHKGLSLSEPLIFGIGGGLFFSHMPFVRLHGMPVTSFRPLPGQIFRRLSRRLGIRVVTRRFRNPEEAMDALDANLAQGIPTACLVGVFHLPYFPPHYRFHFNAHNLVVFLREGHRYYISDPVMPEVTTLTRDELALVRFAKGTAAPRGKMYWIEEVPENPPLRQAILRGIRRNMYDMLAIPLPFFGVKGIRYLARRMQQWPRRLGSRRAALYLGQVVRMQEEIGTGGAGFRYMYAAFLSEAGRLLRDEDFRSFALEMNHIGDLWRQFAIEAARLCKNRHSENICSGYISVAHYLRLIADAEEAFYKKVWHKARVLLGS
ncbi:MAG: BtrH N-terminal domain-containing protein [Flavobacteriales bacterium]|nr:BtrH N-terminal domain-containing protein [Flavobacteriales bacterium]MDW8409481.1 BtrH N-terminal domain-containing protein [Flavobacteriales bacterium]